MTLDEWIQRYTDKTGDYPYIREGFQVVFQPEYGFFYWRCLDGVLFEIDHVCTDNFAWWTERAIDAAKALGCKTMRAYVGRNPAAWARMVGGKENPALSGVQANGKYYWCIEKTLGGD
jgi:hypothetical protein